MHHPGISEHFRATYRSLRQGTTDKPITAHVLATYTSLRLGLYVLAVAFPIILVLYGWTRGIEIQPSLSAYYFAGIGDRCVLFPTRAVLVGMLCAIAVGLYLYKGFTTLENLLLNAAAVFGLLVAIVPEGLAEPQIDACQILKLIAANQGWGPVVHFGAAIAMFICLGLVARYCACKTLTYLPPRHKDKESSFRARYRVIAYSMFAIGPIALVLEYVFGWYYTVIVVEAAGIWVFAWYWREKSRELALSHAEVKAARFNIDAADPAAAETPTEPDTTAIVPGSAK
jgi:hypothetical protein